MTSRVLLVLLTFNQVRYIEACIKSILSQDYRNLELCIFDDHSTDGTYELLMKIISSYEGPIGVSVFRHPRNMSPPWNMRAVHETLSEKEFDYFALCEGDDIWKTHRVSIQVEKFNNHPDVDVVANNVAVIDAFGKLVSGSFFRTQNQSMGVEEYIAGGPINANTGTMYRKHKALVESLKFWEEIDFGKTIYTLCKRDSVLLLDPEIVGYYRLGVGITGANHPLRRSYTDFAHLSLCCRILTDYPQYTGAALERYARCCAKIGINIRDYYSK
jgi:glycosyltransferase involved in cell wall biosynthesis